MSRFFLVASFLLFAPSLSRAQGSVAGADETITNRSYQLGANQMGIRAKRAEFMLSRISNQVVREFARAWVRSKNGMALQEALVLIYRMADGSINAVSGGKTNEALRFTFEWNQAIFAVVHTHPNKSCPEPHGLDLLVADKFGVPIFTITSSGMYLYDPSTRRTSKVQEGLDWLNLEAWAKYAVPAGQTLTKVK